MKRISEDKYYKNLTPAQRKHQEKADVLASQAGRIAEQTAHERSGAAAKRLLEANKEREKAGLITGKLKR
jgi:hypothetical protein